MRFWFGSMHDCSMCGCACYCHGDIDDCVVETAEYSYMHCEGCGCEEDEPDDDYCDFCDGMGGTCSCGFAGADPAKAFSEHGHD